METKYTKGEWHAVDYAGSFNIQNGPTYEDKDILSYDSLFPNDEYHVTKEEAEANAKLITAAPDLFNELVKILPYIENFPKFQQQSILTAIKKATE